MRCIFFLLCVIGFLPANLIAVQASFAEVHSPNQSVQFKGRVLDTSGSPLIGVNVSIKGSAHGTITDFDGKFILTLIPQHYYKIFFLST